MQYLLTNRKQTVATITCTRLDLPRYLLHFSEAFPSFCLVEHQMSSAGLRKWVLLAPWPASPSLWRMSIVYPLPYCLPTSVAKSLQDAPDKHYSRATHCFMSWVIRLGWLLKYSLLWFSRQKMRREDMKCSLKFIEGQSHSPKIMRGIIIWNLLMLNSGWLTWVPLT